MGFQVNSVSTLERWNWPLSVPVYRLTGTKIFKIIYSM
uniref:Uncharacterized protein n=1 Tax=Anguilla anguilla TaxID=7936 RepID=A0A0E9SDZ9_ANGAN